MQSKSTRKKHRLPRGMRARIQTSGAVFFYFEPAQSPGRKEHALGSDFQKALVLRAQLLLDFTSIDPSLREDFNFVSTLYLETVVPTQDVRYGDENRKCVERLQRFFSDNQICFNAQNIAGYKISYLAWRGSRARVRSKREWSLLSVILKWITVSPH